MMTDIEALEQRHSVRHYLERRLERETIDLLQTRITALNHESGLNMQLVIDEPKAFKGGLLSYGKFSGVTNYILVIGQKSEQLQYRAGYYGQKLVIYAQQLGLRTCWVGLTYKKVADAFTLAKGEKVVCCIAIGYGADDGVQHKMKDTASISNLTPEMPGWFAAGVKTALLSPTAVNQMKFRFTYLPPAVAGGKGRVKPEQRSSLIGYTKIDLGIGMCDFETGAGSDNFDWVDSPL